MSYHGLGQTTTATTRVSVASVQCALRARGASIVADGKFGPNTRAALSAQQTSYLPSVVGLLFEDASTGASTISINKTFYEWLLSASPACRNASPTATPSTPSDTPPSDAPMVESSTFRWATESDGDAWKTWLPIGGAVALVGLGVFFLRKNRRS